MFWPRADDDGTSGRCLGAIFQGSSDGISWTDMVKVGPYEVGIAKWEGMELPEPSGPWKYVRMKFPPTGETGAVSSILVYA